ncbi:PD-(D/E)XK nuclease superfamily protein [compost metagenome]
MINIRASSLGELFDCPARWEAKNLLNIRHPSNGKAQLGTAIHAGTAAYDQAILDGSPITVDAAAGELVSTLHNPEHEVDWSEDSPKDAEKVGLVLLSKYCQEIAPLQDYVGVEVTCERIEIADIGISLSGTTDRIRRVGDELGIADLKSGGRAVGTDGKAVTAGHGAQLAVYELLAEMQFGQPLTLPAQVIGLQTAKTTARVGLGEIPNVRAALIGTEEDPGLLHHAADIIHSGRFYGNPKSMLCSPKFCPRYATCKFKN